MFVLLLGEGIFVFLVSWVGCLTLVSGDSAYFSHFFSRFWRSFFYLYCTIPRVRSRCYDQRLR